MQATWAPAFARAMAIPLPMPRLAPVTKAIFPLKIFVVIILSCVKRPSLRDRIKSQEISQLFNDKVYKQALRFFPDGSWDIFARVKGGCFNTGDSDHEIKGFTVLGYP